MHAGDSKELPANSMLTSRIREGMMSVLKKLPDARTAAEFINGYGKQNMR
jgi:hypothetical protein